MVNYSFLSHERARHESWPSGSSKATTISSHQTSHNPRLVNVPRLKALHPFPIFLAYPLSSPLFLSRDTSGSPLLSIRPGMNVYRAIEPNDVSALHRLRDVWDHRAPCDRREVKKRERTRSAGWAEREERRTRASTPAFHWGSTGLRGHLAIDHRLSSNVIPFRGASWGKGRRRKAKWKEKRQGILVNGFWKGRTRAEVPSDDDLDTLQSLP